jgi:polyisoprenoid-binding protein YceI
VATFAIDPAQSQARFYIDEELLGQPKRVEGINRQVAGQVTVNLGDFAQIDFSPITIAADGFVTDNDRRNGAINRFILQTGQYPTITFTPTGVENLPAEIAVGQPFSFQLVGNLTIRDITSSVTLEMTVTPISESELQGSGSVTVTRETYQLTIPSVPSVANVSEDVLLEIDFVAVGK